jgi:hypothetical protein
MLLSGWFSNRSKGDNDIQKFFHGLLREGIYIAPSMKRGLLPMTLTYEDLDFTIHKGSKHFKIKKRLKGSFFMICNEISLEWTTFFSCILVGFGFLW